MLSWWRLRTPPSYGAAALEVILAGFIRECCDRGLHATLANQVVAVVGWASPSIVRLVSAARPMTSQSLAGWQWIVPGTSRPPMPRMVAVALAADMVSRNLGLLGLILVVLFVTYARPMEALQLRELQVGRPTEEMTGTLRGGTLVVHARKWDRPGKTNIVEHTVELDGGRQQWSGLVLGAVAVWAGPKGML